MYQVNRRSLWTAPLLACIAFLCAPGAAAADAYPWLPNAGRAAESIEARIAAPTGTERVPAAPDSFGTWLRALPLLPGRPDVLLYDGRPKSRQDVHEAVVDLDVGKRDLQQCADAAIRLRAEYLRAAGREDEVSFRFTSGHIARYSEWKRGLRPAVRGNRVEWKRSAAPDPGASYAGFRAYLDTVFTYAGSHSLALELRKVPDPGARAGGVQPGDLFIQGGFPGHAVVVLDVAREAETGRRFMLLGQSYMPAQQFHLLRNPGSQLSPWYPADFGDALVTPEWTFGRGDLRRFP